MRDKFLYFGLNAAGTETFNNQADQTLELTTGFVDPIPAGENFLANGGAKVEVTAHSSGSVAASQQWGSGYGTVVAGDVVDITKGCTIHASSGVITMKTVAQDPVYGFTIDTDTTANNDNIVVTQLKPYDDGDCMVYNSKHLKGIAAAGATTTALNFKAKTGDANSVDVMTVTHGSGKGKEFMRQVADLVADPRAVSGMVVIADDMRGIVMPHDEAEIASVAPTFDGA